MTRAILAVCLWSLCGLVGLYTAHLKAVNVDTAQRLESKRKQLHWGDESNGDIGIQIEERSLKMEEGFGEQGGVADEL
ncbi:MAG: hypothetical protein MK291_07350 [Planctomycetes bacterium]|nr:hypothetical protein [Planctomycetota bacterium]